MTKTRYLSLLAGLALFATPNLSYAQAWDDGLLAYDNSQKDAQIGTAISADDEIFAAMQALGEVEVVMDAKGIDLDALLLAAAADNAPKASKQATAAPVLAAPPIARPAPAPAPAPAAIDALLAAAANDKPAKVEVPRVEAQALPAPVEAKAAKPAPVAQVAAVQAPVYAVAAKPAPVAQVAAVQAPVEAKAPQLATKQQTTKSIAKVETPTVQPQKQNVQGLAQVQPTKAPTPLVIAAVPKGQSNTPRPLDLEKASNSLAMAYVDAVYKINGIDLAKASAQKSLPSIAELYQFAFKQEAVYNRSRPAIGDLAFFHNSYDRNRDGRWNDWHSLVGIVESIDQDETITVLIYDDQRIQRIMLNLKYPEVQTGKKKQTLNSQLRADEGAQKGTASKLFGGFANLLGSAKTITVIDNWKPSL